MGIACPLSWAGAFHPEKENESPSLDCHRTLRLGLIVTPCVIGTFSSAGSHSESETVAVGRASRIISVRVNHWHRALMSYPPILGGTMAPKLENASRFFENELEIPF